jgi:hypothetical protein
MNKLLWVFLLAALLLTHGCSIQSTATGAAARAEPRQELLYASPINDGLVLKRANRLALPY